MRFDVSTAMIVTSALTLAVGASLAVAVSRYPDRLRQAMHIWIGGLLLQIPVFLMFGLLGALPGTAAIVMANALFAFAYAEMGRAVRVFSGGDARTTHFEMVLIALLIAVPIVFGYFFPAPRWRLAFGAPVLAALSLSVARSVLARDGTLRAADYLTGGLFVASTVPMLLRAAIEIAAPWIDIDAARELSRNLFFLTGSGLPLIGTIGFLLMCNDRINDELSRLAMLDPLTGVFNRRGLDVLLPARDERLTALAICDLDRFKRINDEHGHAAGDEVLRRVAHLLGSVLRAGDGVLRWGGEEFLLVLPGVELGRAQRIVERARAWVEHEPIELSSGRVLSVTISVGVAERRPAEPRDAAIARADEALYLAKDRGRNRVELAA